MNTNLKVIADRLSTHSVTCGGPVVVGSGRAPRRGRIEARSDALRARCGLPSLVPWLRFRPVR
jgi:hypothetical protein